MDNSGSVGWFDLLESRLVTREGMGGLGRGRGMGKEVEVDSFLFAALYANDQNHPI